MLNKSHLLGNKPYGYDILLISDEYIPARDTLSIMSSDDPPDSIFSAEQYLCGYSNATIIASSGNTVYLGCVDKVPYWIDSTGEKISLKALCSTDNQITVVLSSAVTNKFTLSADMCDKDASTVMYKTFTIIAGSKTDTVFVKNALLPLHKLYVKFSPEPAGYYDSFYTTYVRTVDSNGIALDGAVYGVRYEANTSPQTQLPIVQYFDKPRKQYILVTNRLPKYIDYVAAPAGYNKPVRPIELDQETRKCEVVYNAGTTLPTAES